MTNPKCVHRTLPYMYTLIQYTIVSVVRHLFHRKLQSTQITGGVSYATLNVDLIHLNVIIECNYLRRTLYANFMLTDP